MSWECFKPFRRLTPRFSGGPRSGPSAATGCSAALLVPRNMKLLQSVFFGSIMAGQSIKQFSRPTAIASSSFPPGNPHGVLTGNSCLGVINEARKLNLRPYVRAAGSYQREFLRR